MLLKEQHLDPVHGHNIQKNVEQDDRCTILWQKKKTEKKEYERRNNKEKRVRMRKKKERSQVGSGHFDGVQEKK